MDCRLFSVGFPAARNSLTHMLFEHQVLHSLHDELRAGIHHSGKQPAEERGERREEGGEETREEEEDRVRLVV